MALNGHDLYGMLLSGANALDNSKVAINNLNVFPVPDGDTGINMSLTLSGIRSVESDISSVGDLAKQAASMILRSARGNSGAILSLFVRGMAKAFKGLDEASREDIVRGFRMGVDEAYKAVMKPTEGTILTVMRRSAEEAEAAIAEDRFAGDTEGLLSFILQVADKALAETPEQLPILKEVGVVDAGGYGFVVALEGMLAYLKGTPVKLLERNDQVGEADFAEFNTEDITFPYCTECIVDKKEEYLGEGTAEELHEFICGLGDSVVFVDDESMIKLHVHTDHPGLVMEKALEFGALATLKVENMKNQHSAILGESKKKKPVDAKKVTKRALPAKKYGFVSVCMGVGIRDTFHDLGVDNIIFGGQTMNPSTQDIIDGVNKTPAEIVFVLPNNKNICLVANQAAKLVKDKKVVVIETKSVPQGISAMIAFNPDGELDTNVEDMKAAIANVTSFSITHAVRNTTIEGNKINNGQMLGLMNGNIECIADSTESCLEKLTDKMTGASYITVFCGSEVLPEQAEKAEIMMRKKLTNAEICFIAGGQPLYSYVISAE